MSDTTIKIQTENGKWEQLYGNAIANRLRKDQNLADVDNKQEARNNLELTGDNNTTHYHDSRYLPLIEKEAEERKAETAQIKADLNTEIENRSQDKTDISNSLIQIQTNLENTVTSTRQELNSNMNTLQNNINSKIDEVNKLLSEADVAAKTVSVSGSTQDTSSKFSFSKTVEIQDNTIYTGTAEITSFLGAGTYTIADLLTNLTALSHTHTFSQCTTSPQNCNCDCKHSSHSH